LHHGLVGRPVVAQHDAEPGHALVANHADLDAMIGLRRADDGNQAAFDEIDMADRIAGCLQNLARIELDAFEEGCQQIAVGVREHRQEAVTRTVVRGIHSTPPPRGGKST